MKPSQLLVYLFILTFYLPAFSLTKAPLFKGKWMTQNGSVTLESFLKNKEPVLVSFWASWCAPCLEELQLLTKKEEEIRKMNLNVVLVNVDTSDTQSDVKPVMKLLGLKMDSVQDPKHEIFKKYQANPELPFSALISAEGNIIKTFRGAHEGMVEDFKKALLEVNK